MTFRENIRIKIEKRVTFLLTNRDKHGKLTLVTCGPVAQLGERRVRNAEVEGSIPFGSTTSEQSPLCSGLFFSKNKPSARSLAPPFSQKVTLGSPVRLQAPSQRLAVATNFLRAAGFLFFSLFS